MELKSKITAEENNRTDPPPIYSPLGLPEEVKIPDPIKQKLHNIHPDIIRGKHKQTINAFKITSIKQQYRFALSICPWR